MRSLACLDAVPLNGRSGSGDIGRLVLVPSGNEGRVGSNDQASGSRSLD